MPNVHSTLRFDSVFLKGMEKVWAPPIPFEPPLQNKWCGKSDQEKEQKEMYREYDIPLQNGQDDSDKYSRKLRVFEEGSPETFCAFLEGYYDFLVEAVYVDMPDTQLRVLRSLFAGEAKDIFTVAYNLRHTKNVSRPEPFSEGWELEMAINDVTKHAFGNTWETAMRRQKGYLRKHLAMGETNPREFGNRLSKINRYLNYFPKKTNEESQLIYGTVLPEDELIDILDSAKKPEWHLMMLSQGKSPESFETVQEALVYYEQLYTADCLRAALLNQHNGGNKSNRSHKRDREQSNKNGHTQDGNSSYPKRSKSDYSTGLKPEATKCRFCGKIALHKDENCWENPKNLKKKGSSDTNKGRSKFVNKREFSNKPAVQEQAHIMEAISTMINAAAAKEKIESEKKKTRSKDNKEGKPYTCSYIAAHDSDNDSLGDLSEYLKQLRSWQSTTLATSARHPRSSEMPNERNLQSSNDKQSTNSEFTSYDCCLECNKKVVQDEEVFIFGEIQTPPKKKHKTSHYIAEIIVEIKDRNDKVVPIRALLDTGTTSSIVLREFVRKGRAKSYKGQTTTWSTYGGPFSTKRKALIDFKFPEFSENKTVTWICHVDDTTARDKSKYDMILEWIV